MAEVLHKDTGNDQINVTADKTQAYGLAGNDTLISDNKSEVLLVGGSGDDSLIMLGGTGTLSGGKGSDTFELTYSADNPISAVIEDLDPSSDKIVVNFDGDTAPQLSSTKSGNDIVWKDNAGLFNLTLKSVRDNDYFDGTITDEAWEVLKLTNAEREKENLPALTMAQGLTAGAQIRAEEITTLGESGVLTDHTRPDGTNFSTVLENKYSNFAENLDAGADSPAEVIKQWMGSDSHKENIMKSDFQKLGVGYNEVDSDPSNYRFYWTQLFADSLNNPETVSTADLLTADIKINSVSKFITLTEDDNKYNNTTYGATIAALGGADSITNAQPFVSISGGAGDDTITNSGANATINTGNGNDLISLSSDAENNLIQYRAGDGSDTISGFDLNDTLSISGGEYTPVTVGNDIVVSVGTAAITFLDAANLPTLNIKGTRSKLYIGTEGNDNLKNTVDGATIQGFGGDDTIDNSGANVSIDGGNGKYH